MRTRWWCRVQVALSGEFVSPRVLAHVSTLSHPSKPTSFSETSERCSCQTPVVQEIMHRWYLLYANTPPHPVFKNLAFDALEKQPELFMYSGYGSFAQEQDRSCQGEAEAAHRRSKTRI
ncbi:hypothetical protein EDC01DRAFT_403367 [Geopyxis carbonaria]|nr:hypothetical protein EDC01DRAFT_403367 [Geopyxis carbonaria]